MISKPLSLKDWLGLERRLRNVFFVHIWDYDARLATFPYMGKVEYFLSGSSKEYRSLVVHNHYKLIYRVSEVEDTVYVVALWDTRRNPQDMDAGLSDDRE